MSDSLPNGGDESESEDYREEAADQCHSCGREDLLDSADRCGPCADIAELHESIIGYEKPHRTRECWEDGCDEDGVIAVSEPKAAIVRFVCSEHITEFVGYHEYVRATDGVRRVQEQVALDLRDEPLNPPEGSA